MRWVFLSVLFLVGPTLVLAGDDLPVVAQKDKAFSQPTITVPVGGKVRFINNDPFRHNIAETLPDGTKLSGVNQEPQAENVLTFDHEGTYQLDCLIHPRMKMTVIAK